VAGAAFALAWFETGSIDASDWLPYAIVIALVGAIVLGAGAGSRPQPLATVGICALAMFAAWQAVTIAWAPSPADARDEALLTLFYAVVCGLGAITLRRASERAAGTALVAGAATLLAVAAALHVIGGHELEAALPNGRLYFPINYANAQAAAFLVGFWPAVLLAARRRTSVLLRGASLGCASALLAGWIFTQSKGGGVALAASALVVLAISPARLRLLVPTTLAAVPVALAFTRLVAPYDHVSTPAFHASARDAGLALLISGAAAVGLGVVYALADRRIEVGARARRVAAGGALTVLVLVVVGSIGGFFVSVNHPGSWLDDRWHSFKHQPTTETVSSHFLTIGSNRYDFWRVAVTEFAHHPLGGIGAHGFETVYATEGRSTESPARAHSFELDTLSEEGIVGFVLLAAALGALLTVAGQGARRRGLTATAALGSGAYFIAHSTVDWTWSFPAVGLPVFLLLGMAGATRVGRPIGPRASMALALGTIALVALVLVPPWLSSRFTTSALRGSSTQSSDLRWARRLDPLSTDPLVAQSTLATTPAAAIPPLEGAVRREKRSAGLEYLLAQAYVNAGRRADARRSLLKARRLDPRDPLIAEALARLSATGG
jgi:O-Antigen ligase/Tetratricopeptide repeat